MSRRGATVLVVEDEFLVRDIIVQELLDAGLNVIQADTGEAALGLIAGGEPVEVLFTDIRLPGAVDGWQIALHARAVIRGSTSSTPAGIRSTATPRCRTAFI